MKNLYLIPTDKPSWLAWDFNELILNPRLLSPLLYKTQNIYITNNEEIEKNDWVLWFGKHNQPFLKKVIGERSGEWLLSSTYDMWVKKGKPKKIILTTDTELIADGVQQIDDDFLQWFIQNPSCECVDWEYKSNEYIQKDIGTWGHDGGLLESEYQDYVKEHGAYKIIIPSEEPKITNKCRKCGLNLIETEGGKPICTDIDCRGIILSNETLKEWASKEKPINPNNQEVMFHQEHQEYFYEDFVDGKFVTVWLGKDYIPKEKPFNAKKGLKEVQLKDPNTCEHYKEVGCIKDICTCYTLSNLDLTQLSKKFDDTSDKETNGSLLQWIKEKIKESKQPTCIQCDGSGETTFSGTYSSQKKCDVCNGKGYVGLDIIKQAEEDLQLIKSLQKVTFEEIEKQVALTEARGGKIVKYLDMYKGQTIYNEIALAIEFGYQLKLEEDE